MAEFKNYVSDLVPEQDRLFNNFLYYTERNRNLKLGLGDFKFNDLHS
jgi:hypothetical protein